MEIFPLFLALIVQCQSKLDPVGLSIFSSLEYLTSIHSQPSIFGTFSAHTRFFLYACFIAVCSQDIYSLLVECNKITFFSLLENLEPAVRVKSLITSEVPGFYPSLLQ